MIVLFQLICIYLLFFNCSFDIFPSSTGCSQTSLTCTTHWHSSSVTRHCVSSSYFIISFTIMYWLQLEIGWHVQPRDILHKLLATVSAVHIVSFPLSFCIGCSRRSLTCKASWHSSSVTRYCAPSSYCIVSFIILYWLQSEIADMYSFVAFFINYSLLCPQFILYSFLYHSVLVAVGDRWHVQLRDILHQLPATVPPVHIV